ncbi:MAG: ribose-phosphate diphosphokinase [Clostridiales bacterium]|nr:ribose-phosphate diphosphokinase [Clostridiales bacterium]
MLSNTTLSIFAARNGEPFAKAICDYLGKPLSSSEVIRFSEGTSFVRFHETVRHRNVYLVAPIATAPNDEFTELLFWLDAFERSSAKSITVIIPYFAYAKGDKKDEPRVSIRARVCADAIEMAGADRIMIMDLHAPQIVGFFTKPMDHLYALPSLCETVKRMDFPLENTTVVSPDLGYVKQAHRFGTYLQLPVAIGHKTRKDHSEQAEIQTVIGDIAGKDALIVDDFTISGGTLCDLARTLKEKGARRIGAVLSHNVVSAKGVAQINQSPIDWVLSTDTVNNPNILGEKKFYTVSVAPLFAETIVRFHNNQSISPLFYSVPENLLPYCDIRLMKQ